MIDWNKPKGEICGVPPVPGARYEQDGKYYRVDGSEVGGQKEKPAVVKTKPIVKEEKPEEFTYKPPEDPEKDKEDPTETDEPTKEQVQELVDKGFTHTEIGKKLGISRQKVTRIACK